MTDEGSWATINGHPIHFDSEGSVSMSGGLPFNVNALKGKSQEAINVAANTQLNEVLATNPNLQGVAKEFNWKVETVNVKDINTNIAGDTEKVASYAKAMKAGDKFPPPLMIKLGKMRPEFLDGAHRTEAVIKNGAKSFPVLMGTPK